MEGHSKEFIKEMEDHLLETKGELERKLNEMSEVDETTGVSVARWKEEGDEEDDNADETESWERDNVVKKELEKEVEEINAALQRIKDGAYGYDEETDDVIPEERLRAYPSARTLVR
ncbi:MAG: hypothetical protein V1707_01205 [bacterium]